MCIIVIFVYIYIFFIWYPFWYLTRNFLTEIYCLYWCVFLYYTLARGMGEGWCLINIFNLAAFFAPVPSQVPWSGLCYSLVCFLILLRLFVLGFSMAFISLHQYTFLIRGHLRPPPGAGFSRCIEDPLVAFCSCLHFGRIVVSLTSSPFPFSIFIYYSTTIIFSLLFLYRQFPSKVMEISKNVFR